MSFLVLGPLRVDNGVTEITPTAPKVRQVLALLLLQPGKFIQVSEFIEELWGDNPPNSAMTTLQTYIYKLRKDVMDRWPTAELRTRVSGYLLNVPADSGDLLMFERLAAEGTAALGADNPARAAQLLSDALALWRGSALVDVTVGSVLSAYVTRIEEDRLRALELKIEAELQLGRHLPLISELKALTSRQPLHEKFHEYLMLALHRSGRRHEALEVYHRLRRMLIDELGLEPSASVQRLQLGLLASEPSLNPAVATPLLVPDAESPVVPAQLPGVVPDFTGRKAVLRRIQRFLFARPESGGGSRILSISGMPGVGKTALALTAAHMDAFGFPDGQLYADLGGTSEKPAGPTEILYGFLREIGIPAQQIPASLDARSSLFRARCAGRRAFVVLDDAATVQQVKPLLPATPECVVIITSRMALHGLPGASHMDLDVLSAEESIEFLECILGPDRLAAELREAERIAGLCGYLPIALRGVGSRIAAAGPLPLSTMVRRLENQAERLDLVRFNDLDPRARYDASYRRLEPQDRSALRLIRLLPPPDFSAATACGLIGTDADAVEAQLMRLVYCHLLAIKTTECDGEVRYLLHELTRLYARERLQAEFLEPPGRAPLAVAVGTGRPSGGSPTC
jgi:DNA-binding SARP family transcriptional activator